MGLQDQAFKKIVGNECQHTKNEKIIYINAYLSI